MIKKNKKLIILFLVFVLLVFAAYEYYGKYFYILKNPQSIKMKIMSYGKYGFAVFLLLQVIQVIAFFIPGELIQIAGGYIYGTTIGTILSLLGITIGSCIAFIISYYLGKPFVKEIIPKNKIDKFDKVLKGEKIKHIVLILYVIPGIPKDVLAYICGISDITLKDFLIYSTLGRIPGIIISAYFGNKIYSGDKVTLIVIAVTMSILFVFGVLKSEKIIKALEHRKNEKEV